MGCASNQKNNQKRKHRPPVVNLNRSSQYNSYYKKQTNYNKQPYYKNQTKYKKQDYYEKQDDRNYHGKSIKRVNAIKPAKKVEPIKPAKTLNPIKHVKALKTTKTEKHVKVEKPLKSSSKLPTHKINWIWPAKGPILRRFKQSLHVKGIDIGGTLGQSVKSTAKGIVVYSGHGLKGYGNLIIIKHEQDFLSAYAHNDKLMVKEGDRVARGQEIARMGKTDAEKVKLHFEIRYKGNPIDPLRCLP